MKYIVITSKHHDGFAMFDSRVRPVQHRRRHAVRARPDEGTGRGVRASRASSSASTTRRRRTGTTPTATATTGTTTTRRRTSPTYLEEHVKPQVRELLTQLRPDRPDLVRHAACRSPRSRARSWRDLVHELQPDCLVSGRVGNDLGDYAQHGRQPDPRRGCSSDWETPATINDTWGFKNDDHNWKSTQDADPPAGRHRQQGRQLPAERRPDGRGRDPRSRASSGCGRWAAGWR